jgi:hypothetical protein
MLANSQGKHIWLVVFDLTKCIDRSHNCETILTLTLKEMVHQQFNDTNTLPRTFVVYFTFCVEEKQRNTFGVSGARLDECIHISNKNGERILTHLLKETNQQLQRGVDPSHYLC